MEGKKIFTLYTDLIKIANGSNDHDVEIEAMTDEELGKLFRWILEYVNDYKPSVPREIKYQVAFIKKQLDADLEKYKEKCKKNSENVKKRWNTTEKECIQNDTNVYERIPNDTNYTDKDKDKDKDKEKDNDISNDIDNKKKVKEKTSAEVTHSYGEYKRIKLKDSQYEKLCTDFGKGTTDVAITKLDEYVQTNNNKNGYKDFYLVLRKVIKENWFKVKDEEFTSGSNNEIVWEEAPDLTPEEKAKLGLN